MSSGSSLGVTLTAAGLWIVKEPETAVWEKTGMLVRTGIFCLIVSIMLSSTLMSISARNKESLERLDNDPFQ